MTQPANSAQLLALAIRLSNHPDADELRATLAEATRQLDRR